MRRVAIALAAVVGLGAGAVDGAASIPLRDFLRSATLEGLRLSPDGSKLALVSRNDEHGSITLVDAVTLKPIRGWHLSEDNFAYGVRWVDDERFVFETAIDVQDFDLGQARLEGLYLLDSERDRPKRFALAYDEAVAHVLVPPPGGSPQILIEGWETARPAMYRLDIESGKRERIAIGPPQTDGSFVIDPRGEVRYFAGDTVRRERVVMQREGEEWRTIHTGHAEDEARLPAMMTSDGRVYFTGVSKHGTVGLEVFDPRREDFRWVSTDPRYDLASLLRTPDQSQLIAVRYEGQRPTIHFPDPDHPEVAAHRELMQAFPGRIVDFIDRSRDGRWMLLRVASDRDPGQFYLFDRERKQARFLMQARSWVDSERMAEQQVARFAARDGVELDAYLWVPPGSAGKGLPLVVRPHGGPHGVRDVWEFDAEAQLLASRGFAVLSVNFRGSHGYGPDFRKRGYGQWGAAMIDDIADATRWAIAQGVADGNRICIYGVSYGAFAALMSAAREPALYRCAAGMSGVYDIPAMFLSDRRRSLAMKHYFADVYPETPDERERQSPTHLAGKITAAVLLAHGGEDTVTPLDQYQRMVRALERHGRPPEVTIYRDSEGHGFQKLEYQVDFYEKLLAFFDKHTGAARANQRD